MKASRNYITATAIGFIWALVSGVPAIAEDVELFTGTTPTGPGSQPNILFVLDTSGSMGNTVLSQPAYDPTTTYTGPCNANRVYWRQGTGNPPDCSSTDQWFNASALVCRAALDAFALTGTFTGFIAQYYTGAGGVWELLSNGDTGAGIRRDDYVECEADHGVHGVSNGSSLIYPQNSDTSNLWTAGPTSDTANWRSQTGENYTLWLGNKINHSFITPVQRPKIDILREVAASLVNSVDGVNIGLMRFNHSRGGPVIHAVENVATARPSLLTTIAALPDGGWTPLAETLYEAGRYYGGLGVHYGNMQGPPNSIPSSRASTNPSSSSYDIYDSPIEAGCQKNFVVMITDGEPTQDTDNNNLLLGQAGFANACTGPSWSNEGRPNCLAEQAEFLFSTDVYPGTTGAAVGNQNVITYTVGFDIDLPLLQNTADAGGGDYLTASDSGSLTIQLTNIVQEILTEQTTFTAPTVSVNSFNRTRNLNDIFVALFEPSRTFHWAGNLKKYAIDPGSAEIVDVNGNPAVNPTTGFFTPNSQSYWSSGVDGAGIDIGGAAYELPSPATREVYTYLGNPDLNNNSNALDANNITNAMLGLGAPGDPTRQQVLDFARGADVLDYDGDNNTTEPRFEMGDPLHAQPVTLIYGEKSPGVPDAVVFFATNDGYLHAIDTDTGAELWSFIPPEFLDDLPRLYNNGISANKHYGIDGSPSIQLVADSNGVIDSGETAYLYFGMRRGGSFYYALDVSQKTNPQLLWQLNASNLPNAGQTWSTPIPTRVTVGGATQNTERLALIIAGGYDTGQDAAAVDVDGVGNAIYIVDSESGALLWHASDAGSNLDLADMQYSISGDIKVIDIDSDGYADRMYAADMGGQIWRFDITNGNAVNSLVAGGVIATLGGAATGSLPAVEADSRRFYYSPDIALVTDHGPAYIHIGVGSGHRAGPNSTVTEDAFYALRDYRPFEARPQTGGGIGYDTLVPIVEADLVAIDVTAASPAIPSGSPGWKMDLVANTGNTFTGEKVLAESRTFNNIIFFTSFEPGGGQTVDCTPSLGINRLYAVNILDGSPVINFDDPTSSDPLEPADRFRVLDGGTISSEPVFIFPSPDDPANCVGDECTPDPIMCVDLFCTPPPFDDTPVRTFWSQETTF